MTLLATVENMRRFADRRDVFAYSPTTGERYSATPGDYFWQPLTEPLLDKWGEPMLLSVEQSRIVDPFDVDADWEERA